MRELPRLTRTPCESERHKRNSVWRRAPPPEPPLPQHAFKSLPREVYDCILEWLEFYHLRQPNCCPSCYLKDLCSLSLTSRAWDRAATIRMYWKARVLGHDDGCKELKLRVAGTSRLKLLRRTLRGHPALAKIVREIHLPDLQALHSLATIEQEEIVNLAASLVMACPGLERIVGFHIPYTHTFDRLSYALSTRPQLKERLWVMSNPQVDEDEYDEDATRGYYHAACDPTEQFLELNSNHPNLTTLVLHQRSAAPSVDLTYRAIIGTFAQLPLLRHLSLSGLSSSSFSNLALSALPSDLQSLRLDNLPGVNEVGLRRLSASLAVTSLTNLTLIDLEISRLDTIAGFLSPRLPLLENFTLCQQRTPLHRAGLDIPSFRSTTLKSIHWELRSQGDRLSAELFALAGQSSQSRLFPNKGPAPCLATKVLANSVKDGLLPKLRRLRVPHDPQGFLQTLCKPRSTPLSPSDALVLATTLQSSRKPDVKEPKSVCSLQDFLSTTPDDGPDSILLSPSSAALASHIQDESNATVPAPLQSRLVAHARVLAARENPYVSVRVTDPDDNVRLETNLGGFLGDLRSNIIYDLEPDRSRAKSSAHEEERCMHEWLTGIDDVMGEWQGPVASRTCRHTLGGGLGREAVDVQDLF